MGNMCTTRSKWGGRELPAQNTFVLKGQNINFVHFDQISTVEQKCQWKMEELTEGVGNLSTEPTTTTDAPNQTLTNRRRLDNVYYDYIVDLNGMSFMAAKGTLINSIETILRAELESYFYIGKTFISERENKEFDINNSETWLKTGISRAFGNMDGIKHPEAFKIEKMFILAPINKTILENDANHGGPQQMSATNFDVESYTTALKAVLIKHFMVNDRRDQIDNESTYGGRSSDRGCFVIYLRVAKAQPNKSTEPDKSVSESLKCELKSDPMSESDSKSQKAT